MSRDVNGRDLALSRDHVLSTLYSEHVCLLRAVDELQVRASTLEGASAPPLASEAAAIASLVETFVDAEPHHRREEEVLFPILEARGLFGPPRRMRFEHDELRALQGRLVELARALGRPKGFRETARSFAGVARSLAELLRDHIRREDEVLYPASLQCIDDRTWAEMKKRCDRIGYCSFTPAA